MRGLLTVSCIVACSGAPTPIDGSDNAGDAAVDPLLGSWSAQIDAAHSAALVFRPDHTYTATYIQRIDSGAADHPGCMATQIDAGVFADTPATMTPPPAGSSAPLYAATVTFTPDPAHSGAVVYAHCARATDDGTVMRTPMITGTDSYLTDGTNLWLDADSSTCSATYTRA